jgi:predicted enzyme related to lactoylglutathione lyase
MKVIGIDAIYFVSKDPARLRTWYANHLGMGTHFYGNEVDRPQQSFSVAWNPVTSNDKIFSPSKKGFVFSYRVDDLKALLESLNKRGVHVSTIEDRLEGKVVSILDPDGNKVILTQPNGSLKPPAAQPPDRVTGLGGVFFKSTDSKTLGAWYKDNLGLEVTEWGCSFQWIDPSNPNTKDPATTAWSTFGSTSKYFEPSQKDFMFNYRVKNLDELLASLKSAGVECVGDPQEFSYGKFGWVLDPEGNKLELWEPIDGGF